MPVGCEWVAEDVGRVVTSDDQQEVEAGPVVKVGRDLTEIIRLHDMLLTQAVHGANDPLMPGGLAMVALGKVANIEAWESMQQATERYGKATERYGKAYTSVDDEDPDEAWSAFQLLEFWSEAWRAERGHEWDKSAGTMLVDAPERESLPTIHTEANYLRGALNWAWDHELHWDDFAGDVAKARTRMESIVSAGERSKRGAPCLYETCKGVRLVQSLKPKGDGEGNKVWELTPWHCPRCHRKWDEDQYARMVTAAHEGTKSQIIDGDEWVTTELAARRLDRSPSTIRQWVHKGHLVQICLLVGRRVGFVRMADAEERHKTTQKRKRAA